MCLTCMQRLSVAPLAVAFFFFFFASTSFAPSPAFLFPRCSPSAQWQRKNKQTKNTFFLCSLAIDLETLSSSSAAQLGSAAARQQLPTSFFFRYLFFLSLLLPRAFCTARSGKDLRNIDRYCPRLNLDSCERGKQKAQSLEGKLRGTERVETILKYAIEYTRVV